MAKARFESMTCDRCKVQSGPVNSPQLWPWGQLLFWEINGPRKSHGDARNKGTEVDLCPDCLVEIDVWFKNKGSL